MNKRVIRMMLLFIILMMLTSCNHQNIKNVEYEVNRIDKEQQELSEALENTLNVTEIDEDDNRIYREYESCWYFEYYYDHEYEIPITDITLLINMDQKSEEIFLGSYPGVAQNSLSNLSMHLDTSNILDGCITYYSGGGTLFYLKVVDNELKVFEKSIEEGVNDSEETVRYRLSLPTDVVMTKCDNITEKVISSENYPDINYKDWISHPEIVEVRDVYDQAVELLAFDEFEIIKREITKDNVMITKSKYVYDDNIRKYVENFGSDDSYMTVEYYYDDKQRLRFIFIVGEAVIGSSLEHRIYIDIHGEKLWEINRLIGIDYPFFDEWKKEQFLFNPEEKFIE